MVRAYMPQATPGSITTNTNYPPQQFDESGGGGGIPTFSDEAYVNGGDRGSSAYVFGGDKGKVDYEDVI